MKQVTEVFKLSHGEKLERGTAKLSCEKVDFSSTDLMMINFRYMRDLGTDLWNVESGTYVRLFIKGELFMSDTPMELKSNAEMIQAANGRVFIGGLGIGLLLHNLKEKLDSGEITEIVVAENNKDVIDLVGPYYSHPKIKIWNIDINSMKKNPLFKGELFDTIYLDIWSRVGEDEYEEMKKLQRSFTVFLNKENPKRYINCWMKNYLQKRKQRGGF